MRLLRCGSRTGTVGLFFLGLTGLATAQGPFQCTAVGGAPLLRANGLAELVSPYILACSGGTPTAAGAAVPLVSIQVFINTEVTSRILANGWSEALLAIDDPAPSAQHVCGTAGDTLIQSGVCSITGTGTGTGVYDGSAGRPNVFQGQQGGTNSIVWTVPIDPPPNFTTRTIRFLNLRVNASAFAALGGPTPILADVTSSSPNAVAISNPQQTVGFAVGDLSVSATSPFQCPPATNNMQLAQITLKLQELYPDNFKTRTVAPYIDFNTSPPPSDQDIPGESFDTETGFFNSAFPDFPGQGNLALAGLADEGTRLFVRFNKVPAGIALWSPAFVKLSDPKNPTVTTGLLRRVSTGVNGGGPFSATPYTAQGLSPFFNSSGNAMAVYEVLAASQVIVEQVQIPVYAYSAGGLGAFANSTVSAGYAPISTAVTADSVSPLPRFLDNSTPLFLLPSACQP